MANPKETSLDINELCSHIKEINEINPGISSFTLGCETSMPSVCQPISIQMQGPLPAANNRQKIGKPLSLTFQAILALFNLRSSPPPLPTALLGGFMLIGLAVSFAGVFLQNAFPKFALLLDKFGTLFAAIGINIIVAIHLIPQYLAWICWLACGSSLLAFVISFK